MTSQPPTNETTPRVASPWRIVVRGLEVRLRFVFALLMLAGIMASWPWMKFGWERLVSSLGRHAQHSSVSPDTEFFCPMDPGVISTWPAICPICNMDLISRKKVDAAILPKGVVARMQLSPYRIQLGGIRTIPIESAAVEGSDKTALSVPAAAVVRHGSDNIVYVETMPGMFDGVRVQLAPREGDAYPVLAGLQSGQRVVAAGAFLIDAESRLHSNLATQYFGASESANNPNRIPSPPKRPSRSKGKTEPLSDADLAQIERQKICPVTDAPLGSMGSPVFAMVNGRKIFLCCRGCEAGLKANPDKYLAKLEQSEPSKNTDDSGKHVE